MNMNKKVILPLVILLVILAGGVVYLFLSLNAEKMNSRQMQELAELDKKEMENEYREFSNQYSEMMTKINNDSIIAQLTQEQLRTQQLLKELQQTKSHDAAEITRLKKELAQVRAVLREYVIQIDSLNTLNKKLTADAAAARREAEEARSANQELSQQVEHLSTQVSAGKILRARAISLTGYYSNNKAGDRHSRVDYMVAGLTLVENSLADRGPVRVYVRVKDPEGILLMNNESTEFSVKGEVLQATASREVDYEGAEVDLSIYINDIEEYVKGVYTLEVYTEKSLLGKAECMLR